MTLRGWTKWISGDPNSLDDAWTIADAAFGRSVAVSGPNAVIGADGENANMGALYSFRRSSTTGKWTQGRELRRLEGTSGDHFGFSAAASGPVAIVGTPLNNSNTGAAYALTLDR